MELGETMAANLTSKGVTASASDGLTTLAGKILDISTGGGGSCYHVNFTDKSLTYSDWSFTSNGHVATLEVYLQNQYQAYPGQTVTLSDGTNTYTATTNASRCHHLAWRSGWWNPSDGSNILVSNRGWC